MAVQTLKTLGTLFSRSGNSIWQSSKTLSDSLFTKNPPTLVNYQKYAAYRAAVLHEISKPLVVEDVSSSLNLKDSEVNMSNGNVKFLLQLTHFICRFALRFTPVALMLLISSFVMGNMAWNRNFLLSLALKCVERSRK